MHFIEIPMPEPIRPLFAAIQRVFPSAVIAGGCPRDVYYKVRPITDIDVFVLDGQFDVEKYDTAFPSGWGGQSLQPTEGDPLYETHFREQLEMVLRLPDGTPLGFPDVRCPVQIIAIQGRRDAADLISGFDFGINQVAWTCAKTWWRAETTGGFERDAAYGTATATPFCPTGTRLAQRVTKLRKKFPNKRFLINYEEPLCTPPPEATSSRELL